MEFPDKLKQLRKSRGLSQQALADEIHISRSAIAKWENGLGIPSADGLDALINYFGVDPDYFVTDEAKTVADSAVHTDTYYRGPKIWNRFCNRYTTVSVCLLLLFGMFCLLTQWEFVTLPTDGISMKWIYMLPDGRYIYKLENVPENVYCSEWKFIYTEDGCAYKIPKRSIIELNRELVGNQLLYEQLGDPVENNAANQFLGLPHITKWYLGKPGNAILVYEEGMEITPAPEELLIRWGYNSIEEPAQ